MKNLMNNFKLEMTLITLIATLFFWAITISFLAFQNKNKIAIIGKTDEGFTLITNSIDETDKDSLEAVNFIRHFIALTLNFDERNYIRHISLAGDLMTEKLWNKKETEFKELASFVKKNKVIQTSELISIKKISSNKYTAEIKSYLFKKQNSKEKNKSISISLSKNQRSYENPWRYHVSNFEIK